MNKGIDQSAEYRLMKILTHSGRDLTQLTDSGTEKEVLLSHGLEFEIIEIEMQKRAKVECRPCVGSLRTS